MMIKSLSELLTILNAGNKYPIYIVQTCVVPVDVFN
jgi:hypothetical protein